MGNKTDTAGEEPTVIIVGAGPVGLLTGVRLAQAGIRTTVLEMLPAVELSPRAAVYQPIAVRELDRAGVLEECRKRGFSGNKFGWRKITGEPILEVERTPTPDEPYENLVLGQHQLADVILQAFLKLGKAKVIFNQKVVGLEQSDKDVTLTVEAPEGVKKYTAKYVIGADGGRSTIRQLIGVTWDGFTWPQMICATNVYFPFDKYGYTDGNMIVHKDHYAVIARLTKDGLWRVSYGEVGGLTMEQYRERLPMKYDALMPGPKPPKYDLKMFSPYKIHQRCSSSFRVGRVLLAGDAAHLCNPFGGLGLTGGLLDAGALGDALIAVINDGVSDAILDKYSEVRRDIFLTVVDPATQANIKRLYECDPDTIKETDPVVKSLASMDRTGTEKFRGLQTLAVDMQQFIDPLRAPQITVPT